MYETIEKLYKGELYPMNKRYAGNSDYAKANNDLLKMLNQLEKVLNKEQYAQLEKLNDIVSEMTSEEARNMFIDGFRLGMQLAVESLR
ncbi:MAG: hypothetical protein NC203_05425 [Firmicutes bacterium]|nr:hypothetical protein [[Eubacterium] siraeum]MCM1487791.1 hypothetical protein [Bacillota bacterium]